MQSADLGVMRADELSQLAQEIFPSTPASVDASVEFLDAAAADEDERLLDDVLQRLLVRRKHGSKHSWADKGAAEEVDTDELPDERKQYREDVYAAMDKSLQEAEKRHDEEYFPRYIATT